MFFSSNSQFQNCKKNGVGRLNQPSEQRLGRELARTINYEALNKSIKCLFGSEFSFQNAKGKGAGQTTILKFLGNNWKGGQIQEALKVIKAQEALGRA